jgi:hypothetical protein
MSKLYLGKINLSKIDKTKIVEGEKGKWMDVTIWVNDQPDKYGNDMSIEQSTGKGDSKIYLGNAKAWEKKSEKSGSSLGRTAPPDEEPSDLPF